MKNVIEIIYEDDVDIQTRCLIDDLINSYLTFAYGYELDEEAKELIRNTLDNNFVKFKIND